MVEIWENGREGGVWGLAWTGIDEEERIVK